jgi:Arylsulfotransferase (ASST)
MPRTRHTVVVTAGVVTALVACDSSRHGMSPAIRPVITRATVAENPNNVLSTIVAVNAIAGDSARVVSVSTTDNPPPTPYVPIVNGQARIATLGLLPNMTYRQVLQVAGAGQVASETLTVTTPALPAFVQGASLTYSGAPSGGYTLVSPIFTPDTAIIVVFDSSGRVRWYRTFPGWASGDSKQQPLNSDYTIMLTPTTSLGFQGPLGAASGVAVEVTPAGDSVASYWSPAAQYGMDDHELWLTGTPGAGVLANYFVYEGRPGDLSSLGGPASGTVYGHHLLRQTATTAIQFNWNAWDFYSVADWIEPTGVNPPNDFDHTNALDFDLDSNYIVSFRAMGAIDKIDRNTGAIDWQLGGLKNQFTIIGDPLGKFSGQHCVRMLPNGHLLMFDNGLGRPAFNSRAVEYAIDEQAKTATFVWQYLPQPSVYSAIVGSVQRLNNGNTVVEFGTTGLIDEVDPTGTRVARGTFTFHGNPNAYRAIRIGSLYTYERL